MDYVKTRTMRTQSATQTATQSCSTMKHDHCRRPANCSRLLFAILLTCCVGMSVGCEKKSESDDSPSEKTAWQSEAGPTAAEIVNHIRQAYSTATTYQDKATLNLSYQLQGSFLEEPHVWETQFQRGQGFKSKIYDARLNGNSKRMGCFIFDFGSGNLDDQWRILPRIKTNDESAPEKSARSKQVNSLPIHRLFQDGICRHYITGQDEVPINKQNQLSTDIFFPPSIGWLTGQHQQAWLFEGQATRMPDTKVEGHACFQLSIFYQQMTWIVDIDAQDYLVRQIRYPNELLDPQLQNNPDVNHLEIVAKFEQATWQTHFTADTFSFDIPADAKRVSRFVPVPEPFPSNNVGKRITQLGLRDSGDQLVAQEDWKGKVTMLCWTNRSTDESKLAASLDQLAEQLSIKEYNLARVEVVEGTLPGNPQVAAQLKRLSQESKTPVMADYAFNGGRALGLKDYPVLAVIDRAGVLQYVKLLQDQPLDSEDLASILLRVRSGDDVAGEMRQEYESFLDLYQERLASVSVQTKRNLDDGKLAEASPPTHLKIEKLWSNNKVQQPGNLHRQANGTSSSLTLLDGWRTVTQLSEEGKQQKRKELDLGTRESISVIRSGDRQPELSVVFSVMGRSVRVLDQNLSSKFAVAVANDQQRIRDANLFDFDNDGQDELMVSFTGPRGTEIIEIDDNESATNTRTISNQSFRSSTVVRRPNGSRSLLFCDSSANLRYLKSGSNEPNDLKSDLIAATRVVSITDQSGRVLICVVGTNQQGHWTAIGLNDSLQQIWSTPIGSQRFDKQVESIAFGQTERSKSGFWAIAGVDGSIKLIRDDGKLVDNWNTGQPINGIALVPKGKRHMMVLSTEGNVQAWAIDSKDGTFLPASSSR